MKNVEERLRALPEIAESTGLQADEIYLSSSMLREQTDRFLDDMCLKEVEERIGIPVRIVENQGEAFVRALWE